MRITLEKSEQIVKLLASSFINEEGVFDDTSDLLECQIPEGVEYASKEHARFYFFLIFNDHGTKSSALYERFKDFYKNFPEFFNPAVISAMDSQQIEDMNLEIGKLGLRYPRQAMISWLTNAKKITEEYDSEPINLITSTYSAPELFKLIKSFRSYGPKTSGLLLRVCIGVGYLKYPEDLESVPLPVDVHDSRIAYDTGIYHPDKVSEFSQIYNSPKHISGVEKVWRSASRNAGVEWEVIDRALWILGSKGCVKKKCRGCPILQYCSTGREVIESEKDLFSNTLI